jgi:hypothetical protein
MASDIPYGEVALPAAIAAIKQVLDITIVHGGVNSVADGHSRLAYGLTRTFTGCD